MSYFVPPRTTAFLRWSKRVGLPLRLQAIEARARLLQAHRGEVTFGMNGLGRLALQSCRSGGYGPRRAFALRGASAYDHVMVRTPDACGGLVP